jgi:hypothetical protein
VENIEKQKLSWKVLASLSARHWCYISISSKVKYDDRESTMSSLETVPFGK